MADRIAVMSDGRVLQVGRPDDIYERPTTRFVADFIGETNFVDGVLESKRGSVGRLRLADGQVLEGALRDPEVSVGGDATLAVRPEKLDVAPQGVEGGSADPADTRLEGVIVDVHYLGTDARYRVRVADRVELVARIQNQHHGFDGMLAAGTPVRLTWRTEYASILA